MLTSEQIVKNKQTFKDILLEQCADVDNIESVIDWLEHTDFFIAPASTRFHGAERGYLCQHSLNVYQAAMELLTNDTIFGHTISNEFLSSITLCSLMHDICKANYYKPNPKSYPGSPAYVVDDDFPCGHGEKSVILLQKFIKLKDEEILAIRWHMGGWDDAVRTNSASLNAAKTKSVLVDLLHIADMIASQIMER